jgi:cell division protein FtsZ
MGEKNDPLEDDPLYNELPKVPYEESPAGAARKAKKGRGAAAARKALAAQKAAPVEEESGVSLPEYEEDFDYGYEQPTERSSAVEDDFAGGETRSAIKMAFVGCGQGGGRIAEAFYGLGYRRVMATNTTSQDLESLAIPSKLEIGNNRGGAGKDPAEGEAAAKESYEDIMDMMMRSFGEGVEHIYVCVGGGGGSGTGSWPVILDAAREYAKSTNIEKPFYKHLGVIMSLPKRSEGSRVQRNAKMAIDLALHKLEKGQISSLIIVDNARIHELYPGLPVKKFWPVANRNFAAILHTFNLLAAQDSEYNTFDRADFRSVVQNGLMVFGMTRVEKWQGKEDISKAVRQNLKGTLLADGFDLSTANMAGAIVLAHDDILGEIPMENIDYAFNSLGRALGNEGITLHNGIYESRGRVSMRVFTIISGLEKPQSRLDELDTLTR